MNLRVRTIATAFVAVMSAASLRADISGTPTLNANQSLNLDTGAVGTSGDFTWTGSAVTAQGGAGIATLGGGGTLAALTALYDTIDQSFLGLFPYPLTSLSIATPGQGAIFAVKTRSGNFAKVMVTGGTPGGSITLRFTTYGATGGGGGGGGSTGGGTTGGPTIKTVQNNFGNIAPGLPNYGIAPGALFYIQGERLSNSTTELLSSASPGLPGTLNGVSVTVTVGGTTVNCPLYYLSPTQVNAVLPGTTPLGSGTVTVTNNGTTATFQINVVQSAFGILNYNGGLGAVYDAANNLITTANSANPNQAIVLWGSGVGADPGNDDKLFPQKINNLTNIPFQAYVGGVAATVSYRGRSQFPGVDQVVLTIPGNAPTGCNVSLAIVSGNIVSNTVTIPIAASGRTCSDPNGLPPGLSQDLSGKTTIRQGTLAISQSTVITSRGTQLANQIFGSFNSVSGIGNSSASAANQVSSGSCVVYGNVTASGGSVATVVGLDAGPSIAVNGPAGSLTLSPVNVPGLGAGYYGPPNFTVPASFLPASGGTYSFNNGGGGRDVQSFTASITLPPAFTWTNAASINSVSRTQGVSVTWTGGAPGTLVNISGGSTATVGTSVFSGTFVCQAPIAAGQFTVPVPVLLALPVGTGSLSVGDYSNPQLFTAGGLDLGIVAAGSVTSKETQYTN